MRVMQRTIFHANEVVFANLFHDGSANKENHKMEALHWNILHDTGILLSNAQRCSNRKTQAMHFESHRFG